ncbi:MAG: hypothetical protein ACLQDM_05640 [Bradyrhizobium sp.]
MAGQFRGEMVARNARDHLAGKVRGSELLAQAATAAMSSETRAKA